MASLIKKETPFTEGEVYYKWEQNRILNNKNILSVTTGQTGCLSGDTEVKISRAKNTRTWKLSDLYIKSNGIGMFAKNGKLFDLSIPLFIRSYNGEEIRLHKINEVLYSGKKNVNLLTLENGLTIKGTSDHKIMTQNGWVELCNLTSNDLVMCDTPNAEAKNRKRIKLRDIGLNVGHNHPYNIHPNKQIPVHILIYEARMNNLEFTKYLDILLNEKERCKGLKFIDPSKYVIHHKDGFHYNNSIDNLEKLIAGEHKLKHNNYSNFSQGVPKFSKVKSVEFIGEEDTYDISCEEPYHNFVANNIVVHNSGKSMMDLRRAEISYQRRFNKRFPVETNVCFSIAELMRRISSGNLKKGEILILEEAGFNAGSQDWQNQATKMFNYLLQTFRSMNVCLYMNLPVLSMLAKQARQLVHMHIETCGIDFENSKVNVKALVHQLNQQTGKSYWKFLRVRYKNRVQKIQRMAYGLPSKELRDAYESKKEKFLSEMTAEFARKLEEKDRKTIDKLALHSLSPIQIDIKKMHEDGKTQKEIGEVVKIKQSSVQSHLKRMEKWGYNIVKHKYPKKNP